MPPEGHTLATIDRDAGVAARLRDGSVLWLFGDTAARDDKGSIEYFVIGTASWAPAGAPTSTLDASDPATGEPMTFATPTPDFPACPRPDQRPGMWPASAVVEPVGDRDRVVVWFENICLGSDRSLVDRGMAVGEWWFDPADPPVDRRIRATILDQRLFDERSYGSAAVLDARARPDGTTNTTVGPTTPVDVYRCRNTTGGGPPSSYGPCHVARTRLDAVADPASYRELDGTAFAADIGAGRQLELPGGGESPTPPGGFGVQYDESVGGYIMAYSPWPGPSEVVHLRVADRPEGPWSRPVEVRLPGCDDRLGQRRFLCYAAAPQPIFSQRGRLGLGYYDSQTSSFPTRGSYLVTTVPVTLRPA